MRLLIVEDHPLARLGARMLLQDIWQAATIDEATHLSQAMQYVATYQYDLIIIDPGLPDGSSRTIALERLTSSCPGTAVVVLSGADHPGAMKEALEAGAIAFLSKSMSAEQLRDAIAPLASIRGERHSAPGSSQSPAIYDQPDFQTPQTDDHHASTIPETGKRNKIFSPRQSDILPLLRLGKTNKEIANVLGMTETTVKQHVRDILRRLNVRNRTEAAIAANALHQRCSESDDANEGVKSVAALPQLGKNT